MHRRRIAAMALALATVGGASAACRTPSPESVHPGCPPGASLQGAGCTCRPDLRLVLGACVAPGTASARCGALATATPEGCVALPWCAAGRARDLLTGECLARREVRTLATSLGILVGEEEGVGCPGGGQLVAVAEDPSGRPPRLACLVVPATPAVRACPAGSVAGAGGACTRVADGAQVEVARWLHVVIGAEGGEGTPLLCEALAQSPGGLDAPPGDQLVSVELSFPDNDVSQVLAVTRGTKVELDRVLGPMVESLRALGGTASQAALSTTVRCPRGPSQGRTVALRPAALPENDHEE